VFKELCLIALAGAAGTLCRYGLAGIVQSMSGTRFPWGTLAVNLLGCFLFALVWGLAEERLVISGRTRIVLLTGFMGAFTTFSTFAFETGELLRDSQWALAACNVAVSNVLGLAGMFLGFAIHRWI
jgi:CrcB protein